MLTRLGGRKIIASFVWTICVSSPFRHMNAFSVIWQAPASSVNNIAFSPLILNKNSRRCLSSVDHTTRLRNSRTSFDNCKVKKEWHSSTCVMTATETPQTPETEVEIDPGEIEGTKLRVLKYPHPLLRAPIEEITVFDAQLKQIVKEMFLVMYACNGVGLAAPQVGITKRLMVFNPEGDKLKWLKEVALVNPQIVEVSESTDVEDEGCLSFPKMQGSVRRHKWIKIEAFDVKGKKIKKKYEGWEARVFQHEYDHLDGRLYIDRLEAEDREKVKPRLEELVADHSKLFPELPPAI